MGNLNQDLQIHHFSHPHSLDLSSLLNKYSPLSQISAPPPPCSACKLQLPSSPAATVGDNFFYTCKPCNYFLHVSCTQFPPLITHPSHPYHPLTLLPTPAYPSGKFNCNACNHHGDGFSYHCNRCNFDLHVICSSKPLSVTNPFHPHPLDLTFTSPYGEMKAFSCNVCRNVGSHQWLYHCVLCKFDVHLECANSRPPLQHHYSFNSTTHHNQMFQAQGSAAPAPGGVGAVLPYENPHLIHSASTGGRLQNNYPSTSAPYNSTGGGHGQFQNNYVPAGVGLSNSTGGGNFQNNYPLAVMGPNNTNGGVQNNLGNTVMSGLIEGAAQRVGQTLMQNILGDGNGDGGGFLGAFLGD